MYSNVCPISPEFLLLRAEPVLSALENLNTSQTEYSQNQTGTDKWSNKNTYTLVIARSHTATLLVFYLIKPWMVTIKKIFIWLVFCILLFFCSQFSYNAVLLKFCWKSFFVNQAIEISFIVINIRSGISAENDNQLQPPHGWLCDPRHSYLPLRPTGGSRRWDLNCSHIIQLHYCVLWL